jgi:hypothetical protein
MTVHGTKRSTFAAQRVRPVSGVLATLPKLAEDNQLAVAATAFMGSRPNFLEAIPLICPHALFRKDENGARASQAHPAFADASRMIVNCKENTATRAAALVIPTVGDSRRRHDRLQQFMLAKDSVTVAVEVPVWLGDEDIAALEKKCGVELAPAAGTACDHQPPRLRAGA